MSFDTSTGATARYWIVIHENLAGQFLQVAPDRSSHRWLALEGEATRFATWQRAHNAAVKFGGLTSPRINGKPC